MTVQQLPTPRPSRHVDAARRSLQDAATVPIEPLSDDELTDSIQAVAVLEAQATAYKLAVMAEVDRRRLAQSLGETGPDAWLARLTGSTRAVMAGGLWLARMLQERYDATREAFADGGINEAQTRAIVRAAESMPESVTDDQRRAAEEALVVKAVNGMDARGLRQAGRRMLEVVSRELADEHEADALEKEERRAEVETWMTLHDREDGTYEGRFVIPALAGEMLRAALERLSGPDRLSRNRAGELVEDDTVPGRNLSWTERLGLGLVELIEHLPTEASGGFSRVGAAVIVTMPYAHLLDGLGSAQLDTGVSISAGDARRLACNAGIIPAVLGGRSEPLDLGRESRAHTTSMRRALRLLHDTCAAEGCQRPFAWCDIHHPHLWSRGGPTSVENGVPLCGHHHRRAHDARFTVTYLPSREVRFRRRP